MLHARTDYMRFQDPWGKIPELEPVMLFRAQDRHFVSVLEFYAARLRNNGDQRLLMAVTNHIERGKQWPYTKSPDMSGEASVVPLEDNDILGRLRAGNWREGSHRRARIISTNDLIEAADEIEQLRAKVKKLEAHPRS